MTHTSSLLAGDTPVLTVRDRDRDPPSCVERLIIIPRHILYRTSSIKSISFDKPVPTPDGAARLFWPREEVLPLFVKALLEESFLFAMLGGQSDGTPLYSPCI